MRLCRTVNESQVLNYYVISRDTRWYMLYIFMPGKFWTSMQAPSDEDVDIVFVESANVLDGFSIVLSYYSRIEIMSRKSASTEI